jgi:hypothetical protein
MTMSPTLLNKPKVWEGPEKKSVSLMGYIGIARS